MRKNKFFLQIFLCFFAFSVQAQEVKVETVPLAKGSEAWLVQGHDVPMISVKMAFRDAGGTSDIKGKEGRAQMAAALLTEGAGELDALAFNQLLEAHAIKLGFGVDDDLLTVEMETLSEHADKAFELLALALTRPRFDDDAVARVKAQMHSALRQMEEQPAYAAAKALGVAVYGDHPYAGPTEGTREGIDAISKKDLEDYRAHYLSGGNLMMSVVGDVKPAQLQVLIARHFKNLPETFTPQHDVPLLTLHASGDTETLQRSIPQTVVVYAGEGIARGDEDFYAAFILNHLVGGGTLTSKLGDEIREKRGLAYYAYTTLQAMDHGAAFVGGFGTRNSQAADALKVTMDTLRQVQAGNISEQEIAEAKSYITGAFPLTLASNDGIASMLLVMQRFHLGKDYLAKRNAIINAVTREDILRVAKRLINPEKLVVVGVGNPEKPLEDNR